MLAEAWGLSGLQLGKVDVDEVVELESARAEQRRRVLPGHRLRVAVDPDVMGDDTQLRRQWTATLSSEGTEHVVLGSVAAYCASRRSRRRP